MPVYDDQRTEAPLVDPDDKAPETPAKESLREQEEEAQGGEDTESNESEEQESLEDQLQRGLGAAKEKDKAESGLFNPDGKNGKPKRGGLKKFLKRKKVIAGLGLGTVGLVSVIFSLLSFLNVFRLDHFLQNIDSSTFSRFNASFSGRSDKYVQAFIKLRLTEIEGGTNGDTLFFRANKVDTNNPLRDWYRTLRTSSFEEDVFGKNGISFTSMAVTNQSTGEVTLKRAYITVKSKTGDIEFPFDPIAKYGNGNFDTAYAFLQRIDSGDLTALNTLGDDLNLFADVSVFNSDKEARGRIRKIVKDETRFFQVIKRRHVRKDIQNMTGINSWKFFETTRNKITTSKTALQRKILQKVVPETNTGKFIKCVLGAGACVASNDPAAPENQLGGTGAAVGLSPDESDQTPTEQIDANGQVVTAVDENGNPVTVTTGEFDVGDTSDELVDGVNNVIAGEAADEAGQTLVSPTQKLIADQINSFVGGNIYTKAWSWAKKIAKIHNNIVSSKFSKLVKQAKLVQLSAIYATYSIARDQAKSGQVINDEVGNLMGTLANAQNSEGWISMNETVSGTASAEVIQPVLTPTAYSKLSDADKKKQPVQYFEDRPNDNNANTIEETYRNSAIFPLLDAIASAVNGINDSPIGTVLNSISSFADTILSKILDPIISAIISATPLEQVIGFAMTKIMSFLGAGPIYDGTQAGSLNYLLAGSAAMAEASTRDSGGVKSTPTTTTYTTKLALEYQKEQRASITLYDRYVSLDNQKSLASSMVFGVASFNAGEKLASVFSSLSSTPKLVMSFFSGRLFAAPAANFNAAGWAGVDTYDIPADCQNLDPLAGNYVQLAVGVVPDAPRAADAQVIVDKIMPTLTIETERDSPKFWKLIYDTIDNPDDSEDVASAIYNCALLDQRVMGGLGYIKGYSNDSGYGGVR